MVARPQTKEPLEGTKTGKAKEVDERLKLLRPGPSLTALLLQLGQKTWGLAGLHRDSWHHDSPGTWCNFDLEAWARDLHMHKANLIRVRTQAVKLGIIWYKPDPTLPSRGTIGWILDFDQWPTSIRQHQWGGAGRGQGRKRNERNQLDNDTSVDGNQLDNARMTARNQHDNACVSALEQSAKHYQVDFLGGHEGSSSMRSNQLDYGKPTHPNQLDYGLRGGVIKLISWDEWDGAPVALSQEASSALKKGYEKERHYEKEENVAALCAASLSRSHADFSQTPGDLVAATTKPAAAPLASSIVTIKSSVDVRKRSQDIPPTAELQTYQPALMASLSLVPKGEEEPPKPTRTRRWSAAKPAKPRPQNELYRVWLRHLPEEEKPASADEITSLCTGLALLANPEKTEGHPVTPEELPELMYQARSWRDSETGENYTPTPRLIFKYLGRLRGQIAKRPAPQVLTWRQLRDQEQVVAAADAAVAEEIGEASPSTEVTEIASSEEIDPAWLASLSPRLPNGANVQTVWTVVVEAIKTSDRLSTARQNWLQNCRAAWDAQQPNEFLLLCHSTMQATLLAGMDYVLLDKITYQTSGQCTALRTVYVPAERLLAAQPADRTDTRQLAAQPNGGITGRPSQYQHFTAEEVEHREFNYL